MRNTKKENLFLFKQDLILDSQVELISESFSAMSRKCTINSKELINVSANFDIKESKMDSFNNILSEKLSKDLTIGILTDTSHSNSHGIIALNKTLFYNLLDFLLGGANYQNKLDVKERELTHIEKKVIYNFCNKFISIFNAAFDNQVSFNCEAIANSITDTFVIPKENNCYFLDISIKKNDTSLGNICMVLPYQSLTPIIRLLQGIKDTSEKTTEPLKDYFAKIIGESLVKVDVQHLEKSTKIGQLNKLKVGNTITLDKFTNDEWGIYVNSKKVSVGKIGQSSNRIAIEITDDINSTKF